MSELLATRTSSLRRVDGGDQQQGHDEADPGRDRQQPALRVAADGLVEHRDLAGGLGIAGVFAVTSWSTAAAAQPEAAKVLGGPAWDASRPDWDRDAPSTDRRPTTGR